MVSGNSGANAMFAEVVGLEVQEEGCLKVLLSSYVKRDLVQR
jgi:hypothetical protein